MNGKGIERDRPVRQPNVINQDHKEIVMSFGLNGIGLSRLNCHIKLLNYMTIHSFDFLFHFAKTQ